MAGLLSGEVDGVRAMLSNGVVRRGALAVWDLFCWTLGAVFVIGLRYSFRITDVQWEAVLRYLVLSWLLILVIGTATKFYRGRFLVGSFDEALGLALHFLAVAAVTVVTAPFLNPTLPRSLPVLVPPMALVAAAAGRWFYRALRDRGQESRLRSGRPVLIYGAGDAGRQVLRLARADRSLALRVVGFLDDNPGKRHLRIHGVPVVGPGTALSEIAEALDAVGRGSRVPEASGSLVDRVQRDASAGRPRGLRAPRLGDLTDGRVKPVDIRRVEIGDVLGRHQIETDLSSIAGYLNGKRVLITGAGGSIGSELARQVHRFGPASLTLLDRDESALHAVQLVHLRARPARLARDGAGRHPRHGQPALDLRRGAPGDRLPRRRAEAPADARALPGRRLEDQRARHAQPARGSPPSSGSSGS